VAKHVLNTSYENYDFVLIGLSCTENQYVLASSISDILNISFYLSDYIPFHLKEGKLFNFSLYRYIDEELGLEYFFIPNISNFEEVNPNRVFENDLFSEMPVDETVRLIKELPKTDYFLILKGESAHVQQYKIIEALKQLNEIIQLQVIQANDLASKRNLIF